MRVGVVRIDIDEVHQVGRMRGFRHIDFFVPHFFGVAVVGGNHHRITFGQGGFGYLAHAFVHHFNGFDDGMKVAGMAHHIPVGKINDDKVILAAFQLFDGFVCHAVGFHFRVFGKGGGVKAAFDFNAVLSFIRLNLLAVEERSHVFEFLRFGQAQLFQAGFGNYLPQQIVHTAAVGHRRQGIVRERIVIFGQAAVHARHAGNFARVSGVNKGFGQLNGAVLAEVKENHAVAFRHAFVIAQHRGRDVFVHHGAAVRRFEGFVIGLHGFFGRLGVRALRVDNQVISLVGQRPVFAAVHGVVTALNRGNLPDAALFNVFFQLADKADGRFRRRIASVGKEMNINLFNALFGGVFQNGKQMILVRMDAFVLHQPHQMQGFMVV